MSADRTQHRASDLDDDDDEWQSTPVVEVLLDDETSTRRATRQRAGASRPIRRRTIRSTIAVLAVGALCGAVVAQAIGRPDQPTATTARDTAVSDAQSTTDCRFRAGGCATEEYRDSSPAADAALAAAVTVAHAPLDCQFGTGGCATEAYRLVPATAITTASCPRPPFGTG